MNGALFCNPRQQHFDLNGDPLALGKLFFYTAGTDTPQDTYTDVAMTTPHANPVILDADGRQPAIYLAAIGYKVILTDVDDVTVWTQDDVSDVAQVLLAGLGAALAAGSRDVTSGYTLTATDITVTVDSTGGADPCVINLPPATSRLWPVIVWNGGTVAIALTPDGADTINGAAGPFTIPAASGAVHPCAVLLPEGGSDWLVVASHKVP